MKTKMQYRLVVLVAIYWAVDNDNTRADYLATLNAIAGADKISHWGLNEPFGSGLTTSDSWTIGTLDGANDGTYINGGAGAILGVPGPQPSSGFVGFSSSNNAVSFNGDALQALKMADSASFNPLTSLTMLMWFNIPASVGTTAQLHYGGLADSTTGATGRYGFSINGNRNPRAYIRLQNGSNPVLEDELNGNSPTKNTEQWRDDLWHLLAMTMEDSGDNKEFKVYVDGNLLTTGGSIANGAGKHLGDRQTIVGTSVLAFANDLGDTSRGFVGSMDEIAFVGRALSLEEIVQLWDAAVGTQDGDFNGDGFVDAADYVGWRDTLADDENYNLWKSTFGTTPGGTGNGSVTAVPEPIVPAMLFCLAIGAFCKWPRCLRRSS